MFWGSQSVTRWTTSVLDQNEEYSTVKEYFSIFTMQYSCEILPCALHTTIQYCSKYNPATSFPLNGEGEAHDCSAFSLELRAATSACCTLQSTLIWSSLWTALIYKGQGILSGTHCYHWAHDHWSSVAAWFSVCLGSWTNSSDSSLPFGKRWW